MLLRHCQHYPILRKLQMCQIITQRYETGESSIQLAGRDGFNLTNRKQMMQLDLRVWLTAPEFAKGVNNYPMPGYRRGNSDSKRTDFAQGDPLGAKLCIINVLQNASNIGQKQFARFVQSNSSRQSVEQGESKFSF